MAMLSSQGLSCHRHSSIASIEHICTCFFKASLKIYLNYNEFYFILLVLNYKQQ